MKIELINPSNLIPYERNAKKHDAKQIKNVMESIKQFGFAQPIAIDENNVIIIGHCRYEASKKLKLKEVPCVKMSELTQEQVDKLRLLDNKLNESEWDFDLLLEDIPQLEFDGFDVDWNLPEIEEMTPEIVEDEVPEEVETRAKLGDLWKLGEHRLVCGDSTDVNVIDRLMDGVKADMVFTDPPYNIGYHGVSDKRTVQNDKMDDESFVEFLKSSLMNCETMYVCCSWQYAHLFRRAIEENGNKIKAMIVWDKVNPAQHLDKYFKQHEIIWYCGKFGGEKTLRGDIWQVNTVHPTMKPIELITMALQDNPDKKIVYDGFGGSGSTLIACEQLNRKCYMCELDPHYVDVIIQRWEDFTGKKAELING